MMTTILPYNIYKLKDNKNTSYIEEIEKDDWSIRFEDLFSQNYKLCYYLLITIYVVLLACIVLISIFTLYIHHKTMRKRKSLDKLYPKNNVTLENQYFIQSTFNPYSGGIQWINLIDKNDLELERQIGKGAFGKVYKAEWEDRNMMVAVKVIRKSNTSYETNDEASILTRLNHPNIIKFYGIYPWKKNYIGLVLELMNMGDLRGYLKELSLKYKYQTVHDINRCSKKELIEISRQICSGLCYLKSKMIIHGDLAARNCLISHRSDINLYETINETPIVVKISDFGMSKRLNSYEEYYEIDGKSMGLPVRWLAPECITLRRFSHASDMWSYGVTLVEIFSYGSIPFGKLSNYEVVRALKSGMLPNIPWNCPIIVKEIIQGCWQHIPNERIDVFHIFKRLNCI